jgi:hypothetical protein
LFDRIAQENQSLLAVEYRLSRRPGMRTREEIRGG